MKYFNDFYSQIIFKTINDNNLIPTNFNWPTLPNTFDCAITIFCGSEPEYNPTDYLAKTRLLMIENHWTWIHNWEILSPTH